MARINTDRRWAMLGAIGGVFVSGEPVFPRVLDEACGAFAVCGRVGDELRGRNVGIENDAVRGYELYVGDGAEPDFEAAPEATSATLPFDVTLGEGDHRLVLRYRNGYGVVTENRGATRLRIDGDGDPIGNPPGALRDLQADASGFVVRVRAFADDAPTGTEAAGTIELRLTQAVSSGSAAVVTRSVTARWNDGLAKADESFTLQDATALPAQTGVVTVEAWLRRGGLDGATSTVTVNVPAGAVGAASVSVWDGVGVFE